ncbi:MAG TPA: cyclic pyranopterin monophosphate synthase MoaC [Acidimicrobiales bacterium]|jgi:cyclic pyranopterin phosphate synthase
MKESKPFTHVDASGKLRMVDVSKKAPTRRTSHASCLIVTDVDLTGQTYGELDPVHASRIAGILAAKQTATLIPLCHPLNISDVQVDVVPVAKGLEIHARIVTVDQTGVEMEALVACAMTALSIVSSLLNEDPFAHVEDLVLLKKSGGKSGDWGRLVKPS